MPRSRPSPRSPLAPLPPLSRRAFLGAGATLGAGGMLAACGDDKGDGGNSSQQGGPWAFKDDRGETARAGSRPRRIVAYIGAAAALHDFGIECTGVFGPTKLKNGDPDVQAAGVDVDKVTVIGNAWGQFSIEKYAGLRPELLVSTMNVSPTLWYVPEESTDKILPIAPSVGILTGKTTLTKAIGRFAELAESLGADPRATKVTAAKKRFEDASERLRKAAGAAKSRGGVKVLAMAAQADRMYVGDPRDFTDLRHYSDLGVEFVTPTGTAKGGFFQDLSWENADRYEADLILVDKRTGNLQPAELRKSKPTWARLPAAESDQVIPWFNEARFSHAGYAPLIERLAKAIEDSKKVA
ncbi:ABC transporter substrate-binding protein [Streptomyces flavofungini]|uniref:ABC transporter substrate-binding protein n=1 Tax=Streptomyces flavofungini TaxID=68200 RepID=UPI0025B2494D|nr:ABC transporter substrate-binding protein [Streptomyces flavofungini]WJV49663.1 ABC transporter substrate-binding protein [Streptomyces flavofungini]